jgi:hypothetical protein
VFADGQPSSASIRACVFRALTVDRGQLWDGDSGTCSAHSSLPKTMWMEHATTEGHASVLASRVLCSPSAQVRTLRAVAAEDLAFALEACVLLLPFSLVVFRAFRQYSRRSWRGAGHRWRRRKHANESGRHSCHDGGRCD